MSDLEGRGFGGPDFQAIVWLLNKTALNPHGYHLALLRDKEADEVQWILFGDGEQYGQDPTMNDDEMFALVVRLKQEAKERARS